MWRQAVFVFDTNVLLDVFRLSLNKRGELLETFEILQADLWIPHQIYIEFHRNKKAVIDGQIKLGTELKSLVEKSVPQLTSYKKHPWIIPDEIKKHFEQAKISAFAEIDKQTQSLSSVGDAADTYRALCNDVSDNIEELYRGKIGPKYSTESFLEIAQRAKLRIELSVPPGFKDATKSPEHAIGDIVLWYQIIDHISKVRRPTIFITEDKKSDWWVHGDPHPRLIEEFREKTERQLWIYSFEEFYSIGVELSRLTANEGLADEMRDILKWRMSDIEKLKQLVRNVMAGISFSLFITCRSLNIPSDHSTSMSSRLLFLVGANYLTAEHYLQLQFDIETVQQAIDTDFEVMHPGQAYVITEGIKELLEKCRLHQASSDICEFDDWHDKGLI